MKSIELGCSYKLQGHFGQTTMVEVRGETSTCSRSGPFNTLGEPQHYFFAGLAYIYVQHVLFSLPMLFRDGT